MRKLVIFCLTAICAVGASAVPIGMAEFGAGTTTDTYDGLGLPLFNATPLTVSGNTYFSNTDNIRYSGSFGVGAGAGFGTDGIAGIVDIRLGDTVQRAGISVLASRDWLGEVAFFGVGNVLLGTISVGGSGGQIVFAGWEELAGITMLRISADASNQTVLGFDNLMLERVSAVPEPGSFALLLGALGLLLARRRR